MKDSIESFGRRNVFASKNTSIEIEEQFVDQPLAEKLPQNKDEALIESVQKILNDIKA